MAETQAFVTGWPIHHSRSPLIHGAWLAEFGLAGAYERLAVSPEDFPAFLQGLATAGYAGGNVTIPHKEAAFEGVARRDGAAEAIGAVNTLWFEKGQLVGGNTDAYGFAANLDERLPGWRDAEEALVLGAGGAARGVVHALAEAGIRRIRIVNRTPERAEAMAGSFARPGLHVEGAGAEREAAFLERANLVVNTRPWGSEDAEPDLSALAQAALVTDIVYVPLDTPILRAARQRGHRTADGLGMLLHQAVPGFERWFGRRPSVSEELRQTLLADIEAAR